MMDYDVLEAEVVGPSSLRLRFADGLCRRVNLEYLLDRPIFRPLRDPEYFAQVRVDPECKTIVWPNGADIAPETLHDMPEEPESRAG